MKYLPKPLNYFPASSDNKTRHQPGGLKLTHKETHMNKYVFGILALSSLTAGCGSNNTPTANRSPVRPSVLDVTPAAPSAYNAAPQQLQPVATVQPVEQPASFGATAATPAVAGSSYTVQKGDTLYKIAREKLGDPKQWKAIAAANPGLNPNSLKTGQKITLP